MNRNRGKYSDFDPYEPEALQRKHKKRHRSRLTRFQKWLVAMCVILSITLVSVLAYRTLFVRPDLPGIEDLNSEETDNALAPKVSGERKSDDYYTILLLGRDTGGGGNCDTMMLVSYDVTNQKMTVMSIPRDTMVNVPWDVKKINSVYNYYGGGDKGIEALDGKISDLIGFVPDYSVIVEWAAVGKLVDAIGGVYFDVPRDMDYVDPYQDLSIHIKKGYQKLTGEQAMGVVRWRHNNSGGGYSTGDLGRIETQQAFMKAVIQQLLQVKNVTKIQKFAEIFEKNVKTDLSVQNLFWFGKSAIMGGLSMDNVNFVTMPNKTTSCWSRTYKNYQSYVVPISSELIDLVNNSLSPFVEQVTLSELDIMSVNSDGSVSSTIGRVLDSKAAESPRIPSHTSKTPVDNEGVGEVDKNAKKTTTDQTSNQNTGGDTASKSGGSTSGSSGGNTASKSGGSTSGSSGGDAASKSGGSSENSGGDTASKSGGNTASQTNGDATSGTSDATTPTEPAEPAIGTETNSAA